MSSRRLAAVHGQDLALDEVRPRGAEEEDRARRLLRSRPAAERDDGRRTLSVPLRMPRGISTSPRVNVSVLASEDAVSRVSTNPNATAFTLTLNGPHSRASVFVMPTSPAFAAE
jgi:hypothetical protein